MLMLRKICAAAMVALLLVTAGCAIVPDTIPTDASSATQETTVPAETQSTEPAATQATASVEQETQTASVLDLLRTAAMPVGSTMYVWGGGWNEEDTGGGVEAVSLGLSPQWAEFAAGQDGSYNHRDHRYQIHDGLDCSGYVGWVVYNTLETESGLDGYVFKSTKMAETLANMGLGEYIAAEAMTDWLPGDIMSMQGHVWIVVGVCNDGSVLLLHSSPPGVMFSGTLLPDGSTSQAVQLAQTVMQTHFPGWYERYPDCSRPHSYLTGSSAMRWSILSDDEGLRAMTAEDVVSAIFTN